MSEGAAKKEEKPRKFQAIRGTRDLLPPETALWNRVEQTAHEVFATFGFGEIRPPVLEDVELFVRSVGGNTDIVAKEMFAFGENDFSAVDLARRDVVAFSPLDKDYPKYSDFRRYTNQFLAELKGSIERGEVPQTKETSFALGQIPVNLAILDKKFANLNPDIDPIVPHGVETHWAFIQSSAKDIRLGQLLSLRPEATANVCRAYIEHNMQQLPQPVKLYYMGPMFRRERPQKGRYRQFYQIGAEVLGGSDAPAIDAEVIEMVMTFFDRLELRGAQLDLNSIGCRECRPKYVELLRAELLKVKDKLGPDSQRRIETNPLRVLDSKLESEQGIIATLPRIADHLCEACATHYAAVKRELDLRGVKYRENWRLVRGLDYYMRTTFEITAQGLGSQNAVCGGGRYDGLVELLGGPPTKGIGFAIGEDRLILSLQESGKEVASGEWRVASKERKGVASGRHGVDVYIAWMGEKVQATAIRAAKNLRAAGFSVELPPVEQKFGKALGQADKLGARFALILGDNEVTSGEWTLKTLADGTQKKLPEPQLVEELKKAQL